MQLAPGKPQFGCRAIEQFANLTLALDDIHTSRSVAPVAGVTRNERRLAAVLASRRVVGWRRHALPAGPRSRKMVLGHEDRPDLPWAVAFVGGSRLETIA